MQTIIKILSALVKPFSTKQIKGSIAILNINNIGDTIFSIPAVRSLYKSYNNDIKMICNEIMLPILIKEFGSSTLVPISQKRSYIANRFPKIHLIRTIRKLRPEVIYDLTGSIKSAFLIMQCGADIVSGFNEKTYYSPLYTHYAPKPVKPHLMDMYMIPLSAVRGIELSAEEKTFNCQNRLGGAQKILIHPNAGWAAKNWGFNKFLELALLLKEDYECTFIIEAGLIDEVSKKKLDSNSVNLIESKSVEELVDQIQKYDYMISNDSGPLHVASYLGKPTFTIYGPTNPEYSHPYGVCHQYSNIMIKCSPVDTQLCFTDGGRKGCDRFDCMLDLDVLTVYKKIRDHFEILNSLSKEVRTAN